MLHLFPQEKKYTNRIARPAMASMAKVPGTDRWTWIRSRRILLQRPSSNRLMAPCCSKYISATGNARFQKQIPGKWRCEWKQFWQDQFPETWSITSRSYGKNSCAGCRTSNGWCLTTAPLHFICSGCFYLYPRPLSLRDAALHPVKIKSLLQLYERLPNMNASRWMCCEIVKPLCRHTAKKISLMCLISMATKASALSGRATIPRGELKRRFVRAMVWQPVNRITVIWPTGTNKQIFIRFLWMRGDRWNRHCTIAPRSPGGGQEMENKNGRDDLPLPKLTFF